MRVLKVEVVDDSVRHIEGTSQRTGKEFSFHVQEVFVHFEGDKYPRPCEINLPRDRNGRGFDPGEYLPVPDFYINQRNNLAAGFTLQAKPQAAKTGTAG